MTSTARVAVVAAAFLVLAPSRPWAQEASAAKDPISPEECRKDKKKAPECVRLAVQYDEGRGVPQDLERSIEYLEAVCHQGVAGACQLKASALIKRNGSPKEVSEGLRVLDEACRAADHGACTVLGRVYAEGRSVPRDSQKAAGLFGAACEFGMGSACQALATLLTSADDLAHDTARAHELTSKACRLGQLALCERICDAADASMCLAWVEYLRRGPVDAEASIDRVYGQACDAGVAQGCERLASRATDDVRAIALRERACELGLADSCAVAAHARYIGRGVSADVRGGAALYGRACELGQAAACAALGGIHARGELGAGEADKAPEYLLKACGTDATCQAAVSSGGIPDAWGGSLDALRPDKTAIPVPIRVESIRKLAGVAPVYPRAAERARIVGEVHLECLVSSSGEVVDVRVVRGIPMLDAAAVDAVRQWRYAPPAINGLPAPAIVAVTVDFRADTPSPLRGFTTRR